jgi:hypothetical protein
MKQFLVASFVPKSVNATNNDILINFKNGTLVIDERGQYSFKDFDPNDFLFYQLSFNFDPNASTSRFDKFLERDVMEKYIGPLDGKNTKRNLDFIYHLLDSSIIGANL